MVAESGDESGGERDGGIILKEKAEAFAELDDEAGAELARELDFDEVNGAGMIPVSMIHWQLTSEETLP